MAVVLFVGIPASVCLYMNNENGGNKVHARDLGVHPHAQDLASAQAKLKAMRAGQPEGLDSAELTAWLRNSETVATPLVDSQVRINSDNSIEISGLLVTDRIVPYAASHGLSPEQARQVVKELGSSEKVPVYIHCQGDMNNERLTFLVKAIEVDGVGIPRFMIRDKQKEIESILQGTLQRNHLREIRIENREIKLQFNEDARH